MHFEKINADQIVEDLQGQGGVSFPALSLPLQRCLLSCAIGCKYERKQEVSRSGVSQDMYGVNHFPDSSPFWEFRTEWQKLLLESLGSLVAELFSPALNFNDVFLQRYEVGSQGIGPHMDWSDRRNLICNFILTGSGRFCLCSDREGSDPIELVTRPGYVVILRAPGFMGSDVRPYHFADRIVGPRVILGLRQKVSKVLT